MAEAVLARLKQHMKEIERYGVRKIGVFGSCRKKAGVNCQFLNIFKAKN